MVAIQPRLKAEDVSVVFINPRTAVRTLAVHGLSMEVRAGEFVSMVGPSGCGKTTFLNCVAGLIKVSAGRVLLDGREVIRPGRDRAVVFQNPSLLPWRTTLGNVLYGLERQRVPREQALERVRSLIRLVGLEGFENHYPHELSGGMQQRVNIARALVCDPELLLLDEPFANLDAQTREFMQAELLRIWQAARKTALFITHQIGEAIYLADRVVVLTARPGRVKAVIEVRIPRPRPLEVKRNPAFLDLEGQIWDLLKEEVMRTGLLSAAPAAT